ncbi:MAG: insulinase family protein [Bacteriovoracaceae bacterium]|nr:insulinase family protein [Bacteriovoracaceae bacterium]
MKFLIIAVLAFGYFSCSKHSTQDYLKTSIEQLKPAENKSEQMFFQLDNKMNVFVVSNPKFKKSMVSLNVLVGSAQDPAGKEGLAHFLEHMLFLGTEKYPTEGEFQNFFGKHHGQFNAFTALESTNYHFEIAHDYLDEALSRFSEFFKKPLFNADYVQREKSAVNSEHEKNIANDMRRFYRIKQLVLPKDHPAATFSTGNAQTLKNVSRQDVVDFYQKYYSPNLMNLVIYSKESVSDIKKNVSKFFSDIPNKNNEVAKLPWVEKQAPRLVEVKSISKIQRLVLDFKVDSHRMKFWPTKPLQIIGHYLGHEGDGSLLSFFKKQNLAFSLSAGNYETSFENVFSLSMNLTDKGVEQIPFIVQTVFQYIDMLKKVGLEDYVFEEIDKLARLDYIYQPEDVELGAVIGKAEWLNFYPSLDIDKKISLYYHKSSEDFKYFLDQLTPENLTVYSQHPNVKANLKEQFYGVQYNIQNFSVTKNEATNKELFPPSLNPYLPDDLSLVDDENTTKPTKLFENDLGVAWFKQNNEFNYPQAHILLRLLTNKNLKTPKNTLIENLYLASLHDSINEWRYPADMAGLRFDIESFPRGLEIKISGYSPKILIFLEDLIRKIPSAELSEEKFFIFKTELQKSFDNFELSEEYQQAMHWLNYAVAKNTFSNKDLKPVLPTVTLADVNNFPATNFKELKIESLAYGNLKSSEVKTLMEKIHLILKAAPMDKQYLATEEDTKIEKGEHDFNFSTKGTNHVWIGYNQIGPRDIKLNAYLRLLNSVLDSAFYSEMRTNQQLGYIVNTSYKYSSKSYAQSFLIQSSEQKPQVLAQKAREWLKHIPTTIGSITEAEFKALKTSLAREFSLPDKDMGERFIWLMTEIFVLNQDFGYKAKMLESIQSFKLEDFRNITKTFFLEPHFLNIYLSKSLKEQSAELEKFRKSAESYK